MTAHVFRNFANALAVLRKRRSAGLSFLGDHTALKGSTPPAFYHVGLTLKRESDLVKAGMSLAECLVPFQEAGVP